MKLKDTDTAEAYHTWSSMRNMLLNLVKNIEKMESSQDPRYLDIFNRFLLLAHYYALRSALLKTAKSDSGIFLCATKLSVSLLRHTDIIPADKAFYEAGMACKV